MFVILQIMFEFLIIMGLVSVSFVIENGRVKQRYIVAMMDSHRSNSPTKYSRVTINFVIPLERITHKTH
jgi:hypothetical protein